MWLLSCLDSWVESEACGLVWGESKGGCTVWAVAWWRWRGECVVVEDAEDVGVDGADGVYVVWCEELVVDEADGVEGGGVGKGFEVQCCCV